MRRRVWWGLFIFDSGASTTFGREILLPEDVDVKPVFNLPDEVLTPSTTIFPTQSVIPTIYSSLICQSEFHILTNSMANRLLSRNAPSAKESLDMHLSLTSWRGTLPPYFDMRLPPSDSADWYLFAKVKLAWRCWNFEILATRPFLLRWARRTASSSVGGQESAEEAQCRQICIHSAHATIASIHQYANSTALPRLQAWYALYVPSRLPRFVKVVYLG
jgi:transcriptional regulatory protein GAL4